MQYGLTHNGFLLMIALKNMPPILGIYLPIWEWKNNSRKYMNMHLVEVITSSKFLSNSTGTSSSFFHTWSSVTVGDSKTFLDTCHNRRLTLCHSYPHSMCPPKVGVHFLVQPIGHHLPFWNSFFVEFPPLPISLVSYFSSETLTNPFFCNFGNCKSISMK